MTVVITGFGLGGLSSASAAPLPTPYAASASGTILGVGSSVIGSTLAGTDVARSLATVDSTATSPAVATSSNLGLRVGSLGAAAVDSHTVSASTSTPAASGSGPLVGVSVAPLLNSGTLSYDNQANWSSPNSCVSGLISSAKTQTLGASVSAGVPVLTTGVSTTTGRTSLVAQSAVHDTRSVQATSTGSVTGISLLGGAVNLTTLTPTLTATATSGAAPTASLSVPTITVTSTLGTRTLAAGGSLVLDLGLVGKVTLDLASSSDITSNGGVFSVTALSVKVDLVGVAGAALGSVNLGLLPLSVSATAPTGGVECDTTPPAVAVTSPVDGSTVRTTTPTLAGTSGVPNGSVSVQVDGGAAVSLPTDASGAWSTVSATLSETSHTVTATATDSASNSATATSTFTVDVLPQLAITSVPTGSVTNSPRPVVTGASSATTGTVAITVDGTPAGSVPVDASGAWSFTPASALADGSHTIRASAVDPQGHTVTASTTFTVDTTAPTVSITTPVDGSTTRDRTPVISGSTDQHGGTVTVRVDGTSIGTALAGADGSWTLTPTTGLADGSHAVTAAVSDAAGNVGTASSTVTVDATAPVVAITAPTSGQVLATSTPAVTGTSDVLSGTVTVRVDAGTPVAVTTSATGAWTLPATTPLADGSHTATVSATDPAGNVGTASTTFTVDTTFPTLRVLTPADGSATNVSTPTYTGTSDQPGRTVTVAVDGGTAVPVTAGTDGRWSLQQGAPLSNASHTVVASVSDAAGNTTTASSTFLVDTAAPAIAVTTPADGSLTSDSTPVLAGTSDQPGGTVTVTVDSGSPATVVADGSGGWSLTSATLTDGSHTVRAAVTNTTGSTSQASSTFTVDTTAPRLAVLTPADGSTTTARTPQISGTSDVISGAIAVALDGAASVTVATGPTGAWSTTPAVALADGQHTVVASATDEAGNVGRASSTFTVDATAPVVTITAPANGSRTADATPTLRGTSDQPGTVSVVVDGDSAVVVPVTGGTWSTTAASLTDGPHTVTVSATDSAGNVGSATSSFVVDTVAPVVTVATPATGSSTNDTTPTYSGTTDELGGSVSVSVDSGTPVVVPASATTGAWTYTSTTPVAQGLHTVTATVVDGAGNVGRASSTFTVDTTAPVVTVDTPADGSLTNQRRPSVSGTVDAPGATVSVVVDSAAAVDITATSTGAWTLPLTSDLADGQHTIAASVTDAAGNTGTATSTFTVDATPPTVAIGSPADGSSINDATPVVSGTSNVLSGTVSLVIDGGAAQTVATSASGAWTKTLTTPLGEQSHTATVTARDAAGNVSSATSTFTVDLTAPAIAVTAPANGSTIANASPAIVGTSDQPGASVSVSIDGGGAAIVTAGSSGGWRLALPAPLGEGSHAVRASVSDTAGNVGVANSTFTIDLTAPALAITAPAPGSTTNDSTPTVSGTSDATGRTVSVVVDGQPAVSALVASDGTWSVDTATALNDGSRTATASVTDAVGNEATASSTFTVDTTPPGVRIITPANGSTTNDATPTISGSTEVPGATVTVTIDGGPSVPVAAGTDGSWQLTPTTPLDDGTHTVTATVTDPAGNVGRAASTFLVDATAPVVTITSPQAGSTVTDRTPTVTGLTDAFGATVVVVLDSGTPVSVTAGQLGSWTFTPSTLLGDGPHTVTASVTDAAGNRGTATTTFTVDATAPVVTVTAPAAGSSTSDATPTLTGTVDIPGSAVAVTLDGGAPAVVFADSSGVWSLSVLLPLDDGPHTVTAAASDASGNIGRASSTFTVDTTAPDVAVTAPVSGSSTNDPTPAVTGTSSVLAGSIDLSVDGGAAVSVSTGADGSWSTTLTTALGDGPHTVSATATDEVGNRATARSAFTVDTQDPSVSITAPASGSLVSDDTPTISGTSAGGNGSVSVSVDGAAATSAPTGVGGTWGTVWTTPLSDGPHTATVTIADAAGNTGTASSTFIVDTTAPVVTVDTPVSGSTTADSTPDITGSSNQAGTVVVSIDGDPVATATVASDGSWSYTPTTPLADGPHTVSAAATDAAGNVGTGTTTFTVDTTAPALAITAPTNGSTISDPTPDVVGTSDRPGSTVSVVVDGGSPQPVVTSTVDGSWTVPSGPLTQGRHTVVATLADPAGNTATARTAFTVDTIGPVVTVTSPVGGSTTNDTTPTLTGTSDQAGTVEVSLDGGTPVTVTVATDGTWRLPTTVPLANGNHEVVVTATDSAGNAGTATSTFAVNTTGPAIAVTSPANGSTSATATPVVQGTSDQPGADVSVSVDGGAPIVVTADSRGGWVLTPSPTLADGQHAVSAEVTDTIGNTSTATSTFTVDTTGPVLDITSPADGSTTTDTTPTISGTSDVLSGVVTVTIDDGTPVEVATGADGAWTTTPTTPLDPGSHTVVVTAVDAAGNGARASSTFTVGVATPEITITAPADGSATALTTPVVSGTTTVPDALVTLTITGSQVFTTTAGADGSWSTTVPVPLADGTYRLTATVTDGLGRPASASIGFTVDTTTPQITIVTPPDGAVIDDSTPLISGTSNVLNGTIRLQNRDVATPSTAQRSTIRSLAVAVPAAGGVAVRTDARGNWRYTPTADFSLGSHQLRATATERTGSTSVDLSVFKLVQTAEVTITSPVTGAVLPDSTPPTVAGTSRPGATVVVVVDAEPPAQVVASGSEQWTYTLPVVLSDGEHRATVSSTNEAGHTATATVEFAVSAATPGGETKPGGTGPGGTGAGGAGTGGSLPGTGTSSALTAAWSVLLMVLGLALLRRRRPHRAR